MASSFGNSRQIVKMLKRFKANSIFCKILAATTSLVIILGIIFCIGIYFIKENITKNEVDNNQVYLDYAYSYFENMMRSLKNVMYSIENDSDLNMIMMSSNNNILENYVEINDFCKKLTLIKSTIDEASLIYTFLDEQDIVLMNNGTSDSGLFFSTYYQGNINSWQKKLMDVKHFNDLQVWNININNDSNVSAMRLSPLNLIKPLYMNGEKKGTIVINLRKDFVNRLYAGKDFAIKRKIYITDQNLKVILSNDTKNDVILRVPESNLEKGSYDDNKGNIVTFARSNQNKLLFFVAIPKELVFKNTKEIQAISFIVLVLIMIAGLLISVFMSQRFYLPISDVLNYLEKLSHYSSERMQSQNEMGYIKSNLMKIYSSNYDLEKTVREGVPVLVEIIFLKVLLGDREVDNAMSICEKFSINFRKGFYSTAIIKFSKQYKGTAQIDTVLLSNIIKQTVSTYHMGTFKLADDEYSVILFQENENHQEDLLYLIRALGSKLDEMNEYDSIIIGVGTTVDNIFRLDQSRNSALKAIQNRRVMDDNIVVEQRPHENEESIKVHVPVDLEQRLTSLVQMGNMDAAEQYASAILDANYRKNVTFLLYYYICNTMQNILMRIINQCEMGNDVQAGNKNEIVERIDLTYDVMLLSERILLNIKTVSSYFSNKKRNNSSLDKIIDYVDSNFMLDINLDTIANKFGYNANYLSRSMKQLKGLSCSDYLIKKRIDYSKKLLVTTKLSINEIAEESGYHSSSIYIRAFSKIVGITPGEYRRNAKIS